jgi:hypothetical protein
MTQISRITRHVALVGAMLAAASALSAHAQHMGYQDTDGASDEASGEGATGSRVGSGGHVMRGSGSGVRTKIQPYVEAYQNVLVRLTPNDEVLTYSSLAAGVDMALDGRNTHGAVSVRYERRFRESGNIGGGDTVSGLARVKHDLIPRTLAIEAGGLAARTRVEASGAATLNPVAVSDAVSQVYSVYAGPALATHVGDVGVTGSYMVGYTKVKSSGLAPVATGQPRADIFDHSLAQAAQLSAGIKPGDVLPVGLSASAGYNQEDISNLDQRVREFRAGGQVTVPVGMDVSLIGGVGYQDVKVSSRDAVRNAAGLPVIGTDGRYVTDKSSPRRIAYDVSGLTWDAGVMWRPSRRTSLSAFVGRRYDSTTYYGSFAYAPNARSSLNVSVYDGVSGFGSAIGNALRELPTDFEVTRDPFNGGISGCAIGSTSGGCVNSALASVSSSVFRSRGVSATYGRTIGRMRAGIGAGYTTRKYIAAPGTILAAANGVTDKSWFVDAGLSGPIDRHSGFSVTAYAAWYESGFSAFGDSNAAGIHGSYFRNLTDRLVASASVGLDGITRKAVQNELVGSGQVGLRYNF